jgi:hypothetical protein
VLQFPSGQRDSSGKETNVTYVVGHPGADWGSGMFLVGWYPHLNMSIALASNAMMALNFTTGVYADGMGGGGGGGPMSALTCRVLDAAVRFALPGNIGLKCPGFGN